MEERLGVVEVGRGRRKAEVEGLEFFGQGDELGLVDLGLGS